MGTDRDDDLAPPEPRVRPIPSMPGTSARYADDTVMVDVDDRVRAADLTAAIGRLVPAEARLAEAVTGQTRTTLVFKIEPDPCS